MRAMAAAIMIAATPAVAGAQSMSPRQVVALPSTPATLKEAYGPDARQFGELRLPPGKGPFPVAVIIHGGCWHNRFADFSMMSPMASALTARGYATWNIEYRMLGDEGGGWPGTFQDWGAAADHLRSLARRYPLDLKRVTAVGHSAGGHAAAWVASRPGQPPSEVRGKDPIRFRSVVNIDGPSELTRFAAGRDREVCGMPVISNLMGGPPAEQPQRYALGDPGERLPLKVPQILVASSVLPRADADTFAARAKAAGDQVEILDVTGTGHFDAIAPGTAAWSKVEALIVERTPK